MVKSSFDVEHFLELGQVKLEDGVQKMLGLTM